MAEVIAKYPHLAAVSGIRGSATERQMESVESALFFSVGLHVCGKTEPQAEDVSVFTEIPFRARTPYGVEITVKLDEPWPETKDEYEALARSIGHDVRPMLLDMVPTLRFFVWVIGGPHTGFYDSAKDVEHQPTSPKEAVDEYLAASGADDLRKPPAFRAAGLRHTGSRQRFH